LQRQATAFCRSNYFRLPSEHTIPLTLLRGVIDSDELVPKSELILLDDIVAARASFTASFVAGGDGGIGGGSGIASAASDGGGASAMDISPSETKLTSPTLTLSATSVSAAANGKVLSDCVASSVSTTDEPDNATTVEQVSHVPHFFGLCGCVAVWLCGCVVAWLLVMWLRGCVVAWLWWLWWL
jgi:hypothetical protein